MTGTMSWISAREELGRQYYSVRLSHQQINRLVDMLSNTTDELNIIHELYYAVREDEC